MKCEAKKLLYSNLPKTAERDATDAGSNAVDGADARQQLVPGFIEMVTCIFEKASLRMKSANAVTYGTRTLPFDVVAYAEVSHEIILKIVPNIRKNLPKKSLTLDGTFFK